MIAFDRRGEYRVEMMYGKGYQAPRSPAELSQATRRILT